MQPYLEEEDLKVLSRYFEEYKPETCLEFGCGGSTTYFPCKYKFIKQWISYEHELAWFDLIKRHLDVLSLKEVELNLSFPENYVFDVFKEKRKYDFIFIDGIQRGECMLTASLLLKRNRGRCFLHDTGRKEYSKYFSVFDNVEKLSQGKEEGGGLTMFWNNG